MLHDAAQRLSRAGLPSGLTDARILLAHLLGINPGELALIDDVPAGIAEEFEELLRRRETGTPVQHLTGVAYFRYEEIQVGPGVFVPRPETELLVDRALGVLSQRSSRRVVELCAGTGAISRSIAREIGGTEQWAVEISHPAWPYLLRNLQDTAVRPVHGDMANALTELDGTIDLVVVNPPYVPTGIRGELPVDVAGVDPDLALFGGVDGLEAIRVVVDVAARLLAPGGWVVCEHDESHAAAAADLFAGRGFRHVETLCDLTSRPRAVLAEWA